MTRSEHHGDDIITLTHPSGSTANITSFGAQVLSWIDAEGRERLYLSRHADMDGGSAIRGGIPVIFPQFGTGPLPKHGLIRTRRWSVLKHTESSVTLQISDDDVTRALWPYPFRAELEVELTETLRLQFSVENTGESHFDFSAALHNYFAVDSVEVASVLGLGGLEYVDKVTGGAQRAESDARLQVVSQTDRIYPAGPRQVSIQNAVGTSSTAIATSDFGDWVVWNPWLDGSTALADMEPSDYRHMLCVEAARVAEPVRLAPKEVWIGAEVISVS